MINFLEEMQNKVAESRKEFLNIYNKLVDIENVLITKHKWADNTEFLCNIMYMKLHAQSIYKNFSDLELHIMAKIAKEKFGGGNV